MKNRNIPYYVAALMLAAGVSTSFVSCVDTDEPETVEQLRKEAIAKIQADTKLQNALADVQAALKAKTDAEAKKIDADTKYREAEARAQDAAAEKDEIQNKIDGNQDVIDAKVAAAVQENLKTAEADRKTAIENKKNADKEAALAEAKLADELAKAKAELVSSDYGKGQYTDIETAYTKYLNAVEEYGKAQDEYVAKVTAEKKDLAALTLEVAAKTTALEKAKEAKADVEAVYKTDDYKAWETNYKTAKEELVKAETKVTTLLEEKAEAKAKLTRKKLEISSELSTWKNTQAAYEFEITENFAKYVKLIPDDAAGTAAVDKFTYVYLNGEYTRVQVQYLGGKLKVFVGSDNNATTLIKNDVAETVLRAVANTLFSAYQDKTDYDIQKKNTELKNKEDNFNDQKKKVLGDAEATLDADKLGLKTVYTNAYNDYKADNTKKNAYVQAAQNLFGANWVSADGEVDGIALNGGFTATEKQMLDEYTSQTTPGKWGEYGKYLWLQDELSKKQKEVSNYGTGVKLWNALIKQADELKAAKATAQSENADKLASDKDYLALQNELNEVQAKIADANADVNKYREIANAVKIALGAKTPQMRPVYHNVDDVTKPIYDNVPVVAPDGTDESLINEDGYLLDEDGEIVTEEKIIGYEQKSELWYYETATDEDGNTVYNSTISENIDIESIKKDVLSKLQKAIDDAQADLDAAEEDVKQYNAGNRDSNAAVTRAKSKADEKKMAMDDAKAKLDAVKAAYGVKAE
jgi:hypothetical protein